MLANWQGAFLSPHRLQQAETLLVVPVRSDSDVVLEEDLMPHTVEPVTGVAHRMPSSTHLRARRRALTSPKSGWAAATRSKPRRARGTSPARSRRSASAYQSRR